MNDTDDRLLITSARTRAIRAQVATFLAMYAPALSSLQPQFPSYVNDAVTTLRAAVDRWTAEEQTYAG